MEGEKVVGVYIKNALQVSLKVFISSLSCVQDSSVCNSGGLTF